MQMKFPSPLQYFFLSQKVKVDLNVNSFHSCWENQDATENADASNQQEKAAENSGNAGEESAESVHLNLKVKSQDGNEASTLPFSCQKTWKFFKIVWGIFQS